MCVYGVCKSSPALQGYANSLGLTFTLIHSYTLIKTNMFLFKTMYFSFPCLNVAVFLWFMNLEGTFSKEKENSLFVSTHDECDLCNTQSSPQSFK